ncbi:amidase [Candidatus Viridilinea mediisalina]|uniref:Asp-tRNA(Asn)/Glu-tRNA(Gln) amidotransferase GatCAB subunit A n=1 Tax=Candidatus Viridilinea mediisalina TaxID=2024553 RepID=A0A2A6RHU1_9CHLR|nr:amidase [Candidatus Viridilinea mediisalina]PDW02456.1 Asp-tRNA(Asn)/Glu-tRNA(Gln) amidotransferase GatCAB subunit A [Candidatus Viridilinea mediisalina]
MSLADRLCANLRPLGITISDEDVAGIEALGFLSRLADFERITATMPHAMPPDYLDAASLPVAPPETTATVWPSDPPADTLLGVAAQLHAGALSPIELTEAALQRLANLDPQLNAFQLVLAEQALADARRATAELAAGQQRGPLHGVPVAVKDLFDMTGLPTTAGSPMCADNIAHDDATLVARLREAGAVIIGKTRLSEFAYSPGSNNPHYGPVANPYDQTRDAGGSSSGSAAAVATGIAYTALGTDTGCSIRIPAAFCGIVGLKATWGRTSLAGAVPLAWSLDHGGALVRSVADAALMLALLAGPDQRDGRTLRAVPPFMPGELAGGVRGLRVGLLNDDGSGKPMADAAQLGAARQAAAALASAGAEVLELPMPQLDSLRVIGAAIAGLEAAAFHQPWMQTRLHDYGPFMRQRLLAACAYGPGAFIRAQQARAALRRDAATIFAQVDILIGPIHPGPVPALGVPANNGLAIPINCLGWPALTLPVDLGSDGMPLAAHLIAAPWHEALLLRAAYVVEQARGRFTKPLD